MANDPPISPHPEIKQIGIAVVEQGGAFLVGVRPEGTELAGMNEFPGGKAQPGESPADAAVRECREETGLVVEATSLLLQTVHTYPHGTVQLCFYHCQLAEGESLQPLVPFQWIPRAELASCHFPAANGEVVRLLVAEQQSQS